MPAPKPKSRSPLAAWLAPLALVLLFAGLRAPALGRFVTTDEALWFRRSANFYLALSEGDWAATEQSEHPGAVTMWAGAAAFQWAFPGYAQAGEPAVHDSELLRIMENRGLSAMQILSKARLVLVLLHTAAFAALWPFARRLLGPLAAAAGLGLIALEPFLIAHQRLLHLDGLLASFMLLAVLAYWDHLQRGSWGSLAVSAAAAGLALLTKTPAWFLFPFLFALTCWQLWKDGKRRDVWRRAWPLAAWGVGAVLVLFALYPTMWPAPVETVQRMFSYALGSAQGEFSGPLFFNGRIYADGDFGAAGWLFYPQAYAWRSTPVALLGLALAAWFGLRRASGKGEPSGRAGVALLLAFAIGFMLFMSLGDKQFDRYLLPALPALLLAAGWGWAALATQVRGLQQPAWRGAALMGALAVLQLASAATAFPYYLSYYNPILRAVTPVEAHMMIGWGEGLDQAASYLSEKPGRVAAWYSTSFNMLYRPGAGDIPVATSLSQAALDDLLTYDYLVVYVHQWQRGTPQNLLDALAGLQPERVFTINGIEYVRVYRIGN
jgi:4-amino-4-deoxy-L-arabinose transferase-like glycosyltransferase